MDVRCDRCKTQYQLDESRVSEAGVTVQCTNCHHVFVVKKRALVVTLPVKPGEGSSAPLVPLGGTPSVTPPPAGMQPLSTPMALDAPQVAGTATGEPPSVLPPASVGPGERSREWRVRQASGNVFTLKDLTTLQKWIIERKVSRDDEISLSGESWKRLGDIAELATFFQVVDEAQKAAVLQAQLGQASRAPPAATPPRVSAARPSAPERKGSRLPLFLVMLLLLGGGAYYYFQILVPQREAEAARVAAARKAEEERREQERLERLRAEQAAAEAQAAADAGAGEPSDDGGTLAAVGPLDDGGLALDVGALTDAGLEADAGMTLDGGADAGLDAGVDAGGPKRPAPVRDFDYYLNQGDRLRERERYQAALDAYAQAAELEPDRAEPYAGRGMALLDMGNTGEAETEFRQALKFNPRYGEAIIGLAETYRTQGKNAEAVRYYQRYLEILPNGPEAGVARSAIERLKE